jgi:Cu+-exporting ATPase
LVNELTLVKDLLGDGQAHTADSKEIQDPVCGMALPPAGDRLHASYDGNEYVFCSELCKRRFLEQPEHYLSAIRT